MTNSTERSSNASGDHKQNIPSIRYSGFFEEWEEKKLKDVCIINPKTDVPDKFNYIDLESVNSGMLSDIKKINKMDAPSRAQRKLEKKDILFATVRPYQQNNYYFNLDGTYVASTGYAQIRAKENPLYLYYFLHTQQFLNEVMKRCTGTSYPAINSNDLKTINIKVPSKSEQEKIALLFSSIDQKIESMEKKYTQYIKYRTSIIDKLFPSKNQLEPQIKFDSNDMWNTYELKEIVSIPSKEKIKSVNGKHLLTVKLHCKGIEINKEVVPKITKSGRPYYERFENEILIGRQNIHNGGIGIVTNEMNGGICSNAITSININKYNSIDFVYYYLSRFNYYKRIESFMHGTGQKELSETELMKLKINIPSYEEQKRISCFIKMIDKQIHDLNKEIIINKNFKKSLLSKMFC